MMKLDMGMGFWSSPWFDMMVNWSQVVVAGHR